MCVLVVISLIDFNVIERTSILRYILCIFFFFQAEDGIRDLVRSRGLGDVYKRQGYDSDNSISEGEVGKVGVAIDTLVDIEKLFDGIKPVSYTHLTLPTSDLV